MRRQCKAAAAAEAREIAEAARRVEAARARTPRLSHAISETTDTLNVTLDQFRRAVLEDVLFGFGVAQDYGAELPADAAAQWLLTLEWLRTRPLERPHREDA